jgi:hypothetical protein
MLNRNFEYKKALAQGDKAFEALITTKIVELVPEATATWTNYTLFLKTSDSDMQKVYTYLAGTYGMMNIDINQVGDEYAIDFM